jgi:thiamine-monophosphate kinase
MAQELDIIAAIRKRARQQVVGLRLGIGDDAAIIQADGAKELLACSDVSVEGVHFRRDWLSAKLIGRKALAVTLSDIAAMGGRARFALVSLAISPDFSAPMIEELFSGLFEIADRFGVAIIGGDTSSSPHGLFIDTIVLGECDAGKAVTRAGAQAGDLIFVSGALGASELGLKLLERGYHLNEVQPAATTNAAEALRQSAIRKHLIPEPQLRFGEALGTHELATAMIDLSDGLSTDLHHLIEESGCGALIHAEALPVAAPVVELASRELSIDPLSMVLRSGEEYELLFTAHPRNKDRIVATAEALDVRVTQIGEITEGSEVNLLREGQIEIVRPTGYEHRI